MRILRGVAIACLLILMLPEPALAQFGTKATSRTVRYVHTLSTHVERMSAELMFIALGIDTELHRLRLRDARNGFAAVLNSLRQGDATMDVPLLDDLEVTRAVAEVGDLWPEMEDIVLRGISERRLTDQDVGALADLNPPLAKAALEAFTAFDSVFTNGNMPSILVVATLHCEAQALLIQRLIKDYLMIAYGQDEAFSRALLAESYERFDRVLAGLIHGNADLQLLPAPTPAIVERLAQAEERWAEIRPLFVTAERGGRVSRDLVDKVGRIGEAVYRDMVAVAELYSQF